MDIRFTVTKGDRDPMRDPGKTVSAHAFGIELIPVQRLLIMDYGKENPDHVNFMFEGDYQIWVISESQGTRVTLKLPGT